MKELNIIYVTFIGDVQQISRGFVKKDLEKVEAINKLEGVNCLGVSFSDQISKDYYYQPHFLVKKLPASSKRKYFSSFEQNRNEMRALEEVLSNNHFNAVIFRYNIANYSLNKLVKKYKGKFFFEHNTFEYIEHSLQIEQRRQSLKFSLKPGYFLYYFEGKVWPLFCERYFGRKIRLNAKAGISVTNEIAQYESSYAPGYRNTVITNGVKYQDNLLHNPPPFNGTEIRLFMLIGTGANWHGVDRLIHGLSQYKGSVKFFIDIIGYYYEEDKQLANSLGLGELFNFLPPLTGEELNVKLNQYHISLGTLALHRKNLKEASPLKVRESLMRGFPNVIAYSDPDISESEPISRFVKNLPANETPIDFEALHKFAENVLKMKDYPKIISELAKPAISFEAKAKQTADFIKQTLS